MQGIIKTAGTRESNVNESELDQKCGEGEGFWFPLAGDEAEEGATTPTTPRASSLTLGPPL